MEQSQYFQQWTDDRYDNGTCIYDALAQFSRPIVRGDVLDLGCGSRIRYDTSQARSWVGLDLAASIASLRFLGGRVPPATHAVQGRATQLPFAAGSFDTVCVVFLLHHLAHSNAAKAAEMQLACLAECRRVLRPGGSVLILETWPWRLMHLYQAAYPLLYPLARAATGAELPFFLTPRRLHGLLEAAGFTGVQMTPAHIFEPTRQPVLRITLPAAAQRLLHSFAFYTAQSAIDQIGR